MRVIYDINNNRNVRAKPNNPYIKQSSQPFPIYTRHVSNKSCEQHFSSNYFKHLHTEASKMTANSKAVTQYKPTIPKYATDNPLINHNCSLNNTITPTNNDALTSVSSRFQDRKSYETPQNPYLKKLQQESFYPSKQNSYGRNTLKSSSVITHSDSKKVNDYSVFTQYEHDNLQEEMKMASLFQNAQQQRMPRPYNPYIKRHSVNFLQGPSERQHTFMKMRMEFKEFEAKRYRQQLEEVEFERITRFQNYPYDNIDEDDLIRESISDNLKYDNAYRNNTHKKQC